MATLNKTVKDDIKDLVFKLNIVVRVLVIALLFMINPILAIAINMFFDAIDGPILEHWLGMPEINYQLTDKLLDFIYYIGLLVLIVETQPPLTPLLCILFIYRLIGQIVFTLTEKRGVLVYFPNLFEYFILTILIIEAFKNHIEPSSFDPTLIILFLVGIGKIVHEISLHWHKKTIFRMLWLPILRKLDLAMD